ncbi:MAG: PrpF domain-containing protein, partial [Ketobacter sp.]
MDYPQQMNVPATLMRGGTSKGVFFLLQDLPVPAQVPGEYRDRMLLRVLGSPDPYGQQIDGMGGGSSSTSKAVIISKSEQPDHDVDYEFGQVAIDKPMVDWSGNCGNLTAAVGPFAISNGLMKSDRVPQDGVATVRIWQKNIRKTIVARVPVSGGVVQENGTFELDGVTFPSAPIQIEFLNPVDSSDRLLPTGNLMDDLEVPGVGQIKSTLINAGIPMVFVAAAALGLTGT